MKKIILIVLSILSICSIFIYNNYISKDNGATVSSNDTTKKATVQVVQSDVIDTARANNSEAYYTDYETSLDGVKDNADLIVVGRVEDQKEYGEIGVRNTIAVTNTIKGKCNDVIYVLKSGSLSDESYILNEGGEYILLLGDQSRSGEDTYFIKGGEQGCFLIVDGELQAKDDIMQKELKNITKKVQSKNSNSIDDSQVDILLDYLSN